MTLTCFAHRLVYMLVSCLKENRNKNKHLRLCLPASSHCPAQIFFSPQTVLHLVLRLGLSGLWESVHNSAPDALVHLQNTFYQTYRNFCSVITWEKMCLVCGCRFWRWHVKQPLVAAALSDTPLATASILSLYSFWGWNTKVNAPSTIKQLRSEVESLFKPLKMAEGTRMYINLNVCVYSA